MKAAVPTDLSQIAAAVNEVTGAVEDRGGDHGDGGAARTFQDRKAEPAEKRLLGEADQVAAAHRSDNLRSSQESTCGHGSE